MADNEDMNVRRSKPEPLILEKLTRMPEITEDYLPPGHQAIHSIKDDPAHVAFLGHDLKSK